MKATLWKTHYYNLPVSFKQHNDYKWLWAKIVIYLSRIYCVRLVVCDLNFRSDCDFMEIQSPITRKRSQKIKTVTFKDCILQIYGRNINDFRHYHVPLHRDDLYNPTFACPWRAVNVPSNFGQLWYHGLKRAERESKNKISSTVNCIFFCFINARVRVI